MSIKITQTCAKCGKTRDLTPSSGEQLMRGIEQQREGRGWRIINQKDICADDIGDFLKDANN